MLVRTDALNRLAFIAALACPLTLFAQAATAPAAGATPGAAPAMVPGTIPPGIVGAAPATMPSTMPATHPAAAVIELAPVTQAFVAIITDPKVNVRSGPGTAYYEIGQLTKGDLVYVVGTSKDWYKILPPNGTFCMIAKEFVDVDPNGTTGAVKGDYINVRAGTAINKTRVPSAVLAVVRKGTRVRIIGSTEQYLQIAPPDQAYVYISSQFIKAAPGTDYKVADLKLPAGITGPNGVTVEAPTTLPSGVPPTAPVAVIDAPSMSPGATPAAPRDVAAAPLDIAATLQPAHKFNADATAKFNDVNARYLEESKKPLAQQDVAAFVRELQEVLAMADISPSVSQGANTDLKALDRAATLQRLMKEQAASAEMTQKQSDALRQQFEASQKLIDASKQNAPFVDQGILKSSSVVTGKYALINPQTGRTVAYVDPSTSSVDIGIFVNRYIGIHGDKKKMEGSDIDVIVVRDATLMAPPGTAQ